MARSSTAAAETGEGKLVAHRHRDMAMDMAVATDTAVDMAEAAMMGRATLVRVELDTPVHIQVEVGSGEDIRVQVLVPTAKPPMVRVDFR